MTLPNKLVAASADCEQLDVAARALHDDGFFSPPYAQHFLQTPNAPPVVARHLALRSMELEGRFSMEPTVPVGTGYGLSANGAPCDELIAFVPYGGALFACTAWSRSTRAAAYDAVRSPTRARCFRRPVRIVGCRTSFVARAGASIRWGGLSSPRPSAYLRQRERVAR